jgi:hypothetical protein
MKPAKTISGTEQVASVDGILASEGKLAPSSGFVVSVMERVRQEATAPEPIPFPWRRALPGMIVVAAALVWCAVLLVRMGIAEAKTQVLITLHPAALMTPRIESAGWLAAALGVSLLSWLVARRMVGSDGLV